MLFQPPERPEGPEGDRQGSLTPHAVTLRLNFSYPLQIVGWAAHHGVSDQACKVVDVTASDFRSKDPEFTTCDELRCIRNWSVNALAPCLENPRPGPYATNILGPNCKAQYSTVKDCPVQEGWAWRQVTRVAKEQRGLGELGGVSRGVRGHGAVADWQGNGKCKSSPLLMMEGGEIRLLGSLDGTQKKHPRVPKINPYVFLSGVSTALSSFGSFGGLIISQ
ncbi:hypothetical protein AXG93_1027s1090 [Marchantia polymorpha subsp. ruderalis]|uniref:Uncharacterized protein n=1 Tax=Marchantia polymorpha subsp. ruderalis TaxID=1480154 RepID=A0A176W1M9_MARPO|nr:hypothetical protein AXG93_1027s1090 [Marchantia polymorpha subsp. ruderalis]